MNRSPFCLLLINVKIKKNKTVIFTHGLCDCETRSLTLREQYRLRMSQNGVLKRGILRELR
jgi:hypothetical protein